MFALKVFWLACYNKLIKAMKVLSTIFILLTFITIADGQLVKEIRYIGKHKVLFNDEIITKPKNLKPILEAKQDAELNDAFRRYKNRRGLQQVFNRIGTLASPWLVINQFSQPVVNVPPLVLGSAGLGAGLVIKKPSERALKAVIDKYNDLVLLENIRLGRELSQIQVREVDLP